MIWDKNAIKRLQKQDRKAQNALYSDYGPVLLGIIRRYVGSVEDAEEILFDTFGKIYQKVKSFKFKGSFEGWMKKIAVNESLMYIRRKKKVYFSSTDDVVIADKDVTLPSIYADEILGLMDQLPDGYRTVFNLYLIEGMMHKEIAKELNISPQTSKTQYRQARLRMAQLMNEKNNG